MGKYIGHSLVAWPELDNTFRTDSTIGEFVKVLRNLEICTTFQTTQTDKVRVFDRLDFKPLADSRQDHDDHGPLPKKMPKRNVENRKMSIKTVEEKKKEDEREKTFENEQE